MVFELGWLKLFLLKISAAKLEKPYGMTRFSRDLKISLYW
jgi:hypothetical protein